MTKEKLEIDKLIPYINDLSHLEEEARELFQCTYKNSRVRITYKNSEHTSEQSAESLVRKALHCAINEKEDSLLMRVIEFGIVELLSIKELRDQFFNYLNRKAAGKQRSEASAEQSKKLYETVLEIRAEKPQNLKCAIEMAMKAINYRSSYESAVTRYYEQERLHALNDELEKHTIKEGTLAGLKSSRYYEILAYQAVKNKLKKKISLPEAIKQASIQLGKSESECRRGYKTIESEGGAKKLVIERRSIEK